MYTADFEYGRFVDPVLLDLVIKIAGLVMLAIVIVIMERVRLAVTDGFIATRENQALEAQLVELRRVASMMEIEISEAQASITTLKNTAHESSKEYSELLQKHVDVVKKIADIEKSLAVRRITLKEMEAVHTGTTQPPPPPTPIRRTTLANKPPIPRVDKEEK